MATPAELHAAIVARVQERLALAQAATPGPWNDWSTIDESWCVQQFDVEDGHMVAEMSNCEYHQDRRAADAALIAANDPKWTIDMCTAALNRLERHAPTLVPARGGRPRHSKCIEDESYWPCPDVRDEATVWGVEVDSDG